LVIEYIRGLANQFDGHRIRTIGELETANSIVTRRKSYPSSCVSRSFFDGVSKVAFGNAVVAGIKVLERQT
jgi:hypothetical protein